MTRTGLDGCLRMINWFRSKLSKRQKHYIKYSIALFSPSHIRSVFSPSNYFRMSEKRLFEFFQSLHPKSISEGHKRIGGFLDGSYLIPDIEHDYDGLISPGVGDSVRFEKEFVGQDVLAVLVDATVTVPADLPSNIIFLSKMLGGRKDFNGLFVTLQDIRRDFFPNSKSLALQMDIEGAEYEVLGNMTRSDFDGIDLLLIEFHNLHRILGKRTKNNVLRNSVRLLEDDFVLTHIHPNNAGGFFLNVFKVYPRVIETTWVRKGLVTREVRKAELPHSLDFPNDPLIWDFHYPQSNRSQT